MFRLRYGLTANIIWFFIFYNLERLNEPRDIATFVYILVPITLIILTVFPFLHRQRYFTIFVLAIFIVFLILKTVLGYELWGDGLPISVLEVVCILISLWVFKSYVGQVFDFEDMIQQLTFRQLGIPPRLYASRDAEDLYREVKRSRRFEHPLSLYIVEPNIDMDQVHETPLMKELQVSMLKRFAQSRLANIISDTIRDSDIIVQEGNGFALLFPETNAEQSQKMMEAVKKNVQEKMGIRLRIGEAQFPDNAITLNGLFEYAQSYMSDVQEKDISSS